MRKSFCAFLAVLMLGMAPAALAEGEMPAVNGGIVELASGASLDLNGDGIAEQVKLDLEVDEDNDTGKFVISAGEASIELDTMAGIDKLYAGYLRGEYDVPFLLVSEYGPSDDPYSYVIHYDGEKLTNIGGVPALAGDISLEDGVMTARVRADRICTWSRVSDFVVARTYMYDDEYKALPAEYYVAEAPRASYAMDMAAVLKRDITLRTSLYGEGELKLKEGERVVLSATDDASYVFITPVDKAAHDWARGGYLMLGEGIDDVMVDGKSVPGNDVFNGLLYAD